jgi:exopolysaccharide biosynthesis polyprenyl glycosylphosphotransferase
MKNIRRTLFFDTFKGIDLIIMSVSLLTASKLDILSLDTQNVIAVSTFLIIGHLSLKNTGAYDSKRFQSIWTEIRSSLFTTIISGSTLLITGTVFRIPFISTYMIANFMLICFTLLLIDRILLHSMLGIARIFGRNLRNVLIAGTNKRAMELAKELPKLGYVVKGFIDDKWRTKSLKDSPLILDYQAFFRETHIDEVIICLPLKTEYSRIQEIINSTEEQGIITRLSTDIFDLKIAKAKIEYFNEIPLLTLFSGNMYRKMVLIKDVFDIIVASLTFVVISPLFFLIALAIKLTSKGPIFFMQDRIGLNKKVFKVYKFRTMSPDAEEKLKDVEHLNERKGEGAFKIKNDPRVTWMGKYLRKFSLDELPQLLNVVKGEMSLVGPRPLTIRDYTNFKEDWQRRRFSVKPGMTCLWQISGRDNINFRTWMQLDNQYIDTWSLYLDMKILIKTIPVAIFGHGAS